MKVFAVLVMLFVTLGQAQDELAQGRAAIAKGSYDEAIQLFQKYLQANTRNVEGNYLLGEAFRLKGDLANAQTSLERALDFDDEYEPALVSIVRVYGKLNLWDKAAKRFKELEKYHKTSTKGAIAYGQTFLETDSLDKASIYFSKAKEIDPKNVEVYIGLAEVYSRQNVIVLAVENLRTATQLKPEDPVLWYRLATTILKNRGLNAAQIQELIAALQKSIELDPKNDKAIYDAANTMFRTKAYWREAAEFFKMYVELKKDNTEAWEKYAISLYNARAYKDAIPVLEYALKVNPNSAEMKPMLAYSYYLAKEYQKSLDLYKTFPADSLAAEEVYRMGFSFYQIKDTVNAIKYLERTLVLQKDNTDAIGTLAAIFLTQKKYDKAGGYYEQLLEKDPKNITALFYAAYSYNVLEKMDTAKNYYKRLIALRPNNMQSHQALIGIYSQQDSAEFGRYHAEVLIGLADSALKAEPAKAVQHTAMIMSGYRSLALFEWRAKNVVGAIEKLEKAATYEKDKKDENLHLFMAQMYAVRSGDAQLLDDEAKKIRARACQEYALVLKINPKNAAAKKESTQMNCGK
ncbi:MAG: tetratricopeptide repeat protein [Bacteroidetes bacterium]|nr:tetratricopeptide repeat protein [Bacteroidota bacterium]